MMRIRFAAALGLALAAASATVSADSLDFVAVADAEAFDTGGDGTFDVLDGSDLSLSVRNFKDLTVDPFEQRTLAEFDLGALPAGAVISGVSFRFQSIGFANSNTAVNVFGYAGDGTTTLADATAAAVLLGSYDPVALGLGLQTVTLDLAAFSGLLGSSSIIGLRFEGILNTNAQFASLEAAALLSDVPPTLVVDFAGQAVPEPSSVVLAGLGVLGLAGFARRARKPAAA